MAPHASTLAWKIPWLEGPGRLQSMASRRVGHDWATSLSLFTFMHWRRKWQPTLVFLPGESQGQGILVSCHLWGRTESDTNEAAVKAMVFPVVMYGSESWTIKKAECRRIDAFELWCWRRLLRDPWTARRSNQSILKEISLGCSLEALMLKLKLQYFGHWCEELTHLKRSWCWERLRTGGEGDDRGWDGWMASPTQWTWVWLDSGSWWWTGRPGMLQFMGSLRVGHDGATELNWTDVLRTRWSPGR